MVTGANAPTGLAFILSPPFVALLPSTEPAVLQCQLGIREHDAQKRRRTWENARYPRQWLPTWLPPKLGAFRW